MKTTARRATSIAAAAALVAVICVAGLPAGATSSSSSGQPLRFNQAIPLSSFSPLRTAESHVYSLQNGQGPSDHEWSGEPGIEVDRFGTIYVSGVCCVGPASPVWVSRNHGRTFRELRTPAHVREWTIGAEGDLEVDDAGRVFFADTSAAEVQFTQWSSEGRTWDFTIPALILPVDDRPWLAWTPRYLYMFINYDRFVQVYRSPDGGILWGTSGPMRWNGAVGGFFPGHMTADRRTGTVWVTGQVPNAAGHEQLGAAVSTDGARTFHDSVVDRLPKHSHLSPIFPGIATVDQAGNGYTTWSAWTKKGCAVSFAGSSNLGRTWSKPVQVSAGPGCATFPWIDARRQGELALAYYQTATTKQKKGTAPFQDQVPDKAPWHLEVAYVTGALSKHPVITRAQVPLPTPVFLGPMLRQGWDYLGVDLGADGVIRTVFAVKYRDSAPQTWFVSSKPVA